MHDDNIHERIDAVIAENNNLSMQTPYVQGKKHTKKHRSKSFYVFIGSFSVTLLLLLTLIFPVFADKSGIEIIQEMLNSSDETTTISLGDETPPELPPSNRFGNWAEPETFNITVTEDTNTITVTTNNTFEWNFFKDTFGYNEIWHNGSILVQNEQWYLEYQKTPSTWKPRGTPYNVTYEQLAPNHVIVTRKYTDYISTDFNVTFDFLNNNRVKITLIGDIGQVDTYRVRWDASGINTEHMEYNSSANHTKIWTGTDEGIVFNYEDVYSSFGNITTVETEQQANNHKLHHYFYVGELSVGDFVLDPWFGSQDSSSGYNARVYYDGATNYVYFTGTHGSPASSGTADSITIDIALVDQALGIECFLYEWVSDGNAGAKIATTEAKDISTTGLHSFAFSDPKPSVTSGTDYYVSFRGTDPTGNYDMTCERGAAGDTIVKHVTSGTVTADDPLTGESSFADTVKIYCSYTESAANTAPTQTAQKIWNGTSKVEKSLNATGVSLSPTCFNVTVADTDSDQMNVTIKTNESGTWTTVNATTSGMTDGTYHGYNTSWIDTCDTKYWISFNVSDDSEWSNKTFWFWTYNITWQVIDASINGTVYNTSHWGVIDSSINGTVYNDTEIWSVIDNSINGTIYNTSRWQVIDTSINGTVYNTSHWGVIDSSINGTVYNDTEIWSVIDNSINGTVYNITGSFWYVIDNTINGTVYNDTETWSVIDNSINGTVSNATAWSPMSPTQSNEVPSDGSQLSSDLTQLCIDLDDGGDGDNMYWEILQGGNVLENGTPFSYPTTTYNFTDSINNTAYWECSPTTLRMTSENVFSSSEYTNISMVDSLNLTTNCTSYDWTHHHFLFNISEAKYDVTNIAVNWHGYAGYYTSGAKPKWYWDATMYIKKGTWGSGVNSTPTPYTGSPSLEWFNYSIDDNGFIDGTGFIEIAVENSVAGQPSVVYTDYVEVIITYVTGGDPSGTYCTNNVSFWNNATCEEWWTWSVFVDDGHHNSYTTDYTFQNSPCVLSTYFYPVNNATNICPCCDAICFGVGNLYDRVNLTVYRNDSLNTTFYIVEEYYNITNDTYCFCIDGHIAGGRYYPMRYNETYYWYVNASKVGNASLYSTSSVHKFTTANNLADCPCGIDNIGSGEIVTGYLTYSIIGLIGLFGLFGFFIQRKRRRNDY